MAAAAHHKVSEHAAAATAAADMLGYLFPARARVFAAKAEEAMQVAPAAGADHPEDVEAGRAIGQRVAALAIARGKADGSDAKWNGSVPEGPGKWKGQNPIAPLAGTWQPWVLARVRAAPAGAARIQLRADQGGTRRAEGVPRTPKMNHRATFWEVNGGARAHLLWNEIARTKLLERRHRAGDRCARARGAQRRDDRRRRSPAGTPSTPTGTSGRRSSTRS